MKKIAQFFKDVVAEMKKVVWPSRDEVMASARVVIISVLLISLLLGLFDLLLAWLVRQVF